MAVPYNHKAIEKKWRENWEKNPVNVKVDKTGKEREKYYCLDMFPYSIRKWPPRRTLERICYF